MSHTTQTNTSDFLTNAQGHLVPRSLVKPIDLARDELVQEMVTKAKTMRQQLQALKTAFFGDFQAFVKLSAEEYGVQRGGSKGNVTLHSFDGRYKVRLAHADTMKFDERLQAAKTIIDDLMTEWTEGSRPEIKAIIQRAFDTDKEGNLNTGRVLSLRSLDIKDARWQQAMTAIGDSVQVVGTKSYVRFYERIEGTDEYQAVLLDLAKV
ncbi:MULTISPECIES: DUF3164 family protein [Ralstonia solanacearum species complex]|uniref:DUF3164 family protein n=1 Tax=Ralstonia solanacearum species complex TaxID=3116862 RepID=UPI000E58D579|nr:DUF3164 family protein [Ralstonia solanacearum]BEU73999.1 DUF3164 family protein [Ralstonia pseudosolanacearum]AXV78908.1 sulfate transporter [Ralstonia solanacearum]AXV92930.1 sulfate transporter [Ralstonia solanacearum]AXW20992.1 sulfate transporter [Ralstonia solanacearum]AXW77828.1 sulfate transporter [Ralstonia solanacearum]